MKKIQGVKNFGNEGEGRFHEILSCPPKIRVAPQVPPQIPRPGAATVVLIFSLFHACFPQH